MKEKIKIIICIIILLIISIINLLNGKYLNAFYQNYYIKQSIWFIIGFIVLMMLAKIKKNIFFKDSHYLYYFNLLLLIIVLFWGRSINGSKGWLHLGLLSFQPSEFMKISLNLYLLKIYTSDEKRLKKIIKMFLYTFLASLLVFLEPDTGAIIFYIIILLVCLHPLKINYKYYIATFVTFIFVLTIGFYLYLYQKEIVIKILGTNILYRADRIINFKTNNYQRDLAMLSIFGSSFSLHTFKEILTYIPEGTTDFMLAFIIGNFGLISFLIIILIYYILLTNLLKLIKNPHNKKTNYLIISFVYILFIQIMINVGMNIGLIPIIGITLPFLSYGGSNLIVNFIYLGIIFNLTNKDD